MKSFSPPFPAILLSAARPPIRAWSPGPGSHPGEVSRKCLFSISELAFSQKHGSRKTCSLGKEAPGRNYVKCKAPHPGPFPTCPAPVPRGLALARLPLRPRAGHVHRGAPFPSQHSLAWLPRRVLADEHEPCSVPHTVPHVPCARPSGSQWSPVVHGYKQQEGEHRGCWRAWLCCEGLSPTPASPPPATLPTLSDAASSSVKLLGKTPLPRSC